MVLKGENCKKGGKNGCFYYFKEWFFCDCKFDAFKLKIKNDINSNDCLFATRLNNRLSKRIVWDNIVPIERFFKHYLFDKDIKICNKNIRSTSLCFSEYFKSYRAVTTDIFNKVPVIEEVANFRKDSLFADIKYQNYIIILVF